MEAPKVFISHARIDKDRFVRDFATKLRSQGIDAKVDEWEILPGDSLVEKIFEEGIGQAQAVIVVVSENSVDRPWVREELNAATVRKIQGAIKLIPVVIGEVDESRIPISLQSLAWERIRNLDSYDAELDRVVRSIRGHYEKPPLGKPPAHTRSTLDIIPGLNEIDSTILQLCCEALIEQERPLRFKPQEIYEVLESVGVHQENALESLQILHARGYIKAMTTISGAIYDFAVTDYGLEEYASTYTPNYDSLPRAVALQIANLGRRTGRQIAGALDQPVMIVRHVLGVLERRSFIRTRSMGHDRQIVRVSPELGRWLRETG
jgi:hypothetical protein